MKEQINTNISGPTDEQVQAAWDLVAEYVMYHGTEE